MSMSCTHQKSASLVRDCSRELADRVQAYSDHQASSPKSVSVLAFCQLFLQCFNTLLQAL